LPLDELCPRIAADICSARELCACETGLENCAKEELARCEEQSDHFEADSDLDYAAERAASVANAQVEALDACGGPVPLGQFFEGTRADGEECERDSQCESGACDPDAQICQAPEPVSLCPAS
jgi:hypothetical protein